MVTSYIKMAVFVFVAIIFALTVGFTNGSPIPSSIASPDLKSTIMDKLHKIPELIKSSIPMPKNVALTVNIDNRESDTVSAGGGGARHSASKSTGYGDDEGLFPNSNKTDIPSNHILTMVIISIGVFVVGTIFVLTLWFCFRRRKPTTIVTTPRIDNCTEVAPMRNYKYQNNSPKEKELLKMPNVQKLISNFNKK